MNKEDTSSAQDEIKRIIAESIQEIIEFSQTDVGTGAQSGLNPGGESNSEEQEKQASKAANSDSFDSTALIGEDSLLDSLSLLHFINLLERKIKKQFSKEIKILNEIDFSPQSNSFKNLDSLAAKIEMMLEE